MKFPSINPIVRIAIGLVGLVTSCVLFATFLGLLPDQFNEAVKQRESTCESVAISFSLMANRVDQQVIEDYLKQVRDRNPDCLSMGLRSIEGEQVLEIGDHFPNWEDDLKERSTAEQIAVPIYADQDVWGYLEMRYAPVVSPGILGIFERTDVQLALFIALASFISFNLYLRFVLSQLNPSKVIPGRVRNALDTLAEGLAIIDRKQRIVLTNQTFQDSVGKSLESMIGKSIDDVGLFNQEGNDQNSDQFPWSEALQTKNSVCGKLMTIQDNAGDARHFSVSCGPILDADQSVQGVIVSFEDVTQLEQKKNQLERMLFELDQSTDEIRRQNQELELLATQDPLTGCLNRRSYFERFESHFEAANQSGISLSVFMVDIDHFKSINDNHGHAVGDEVLRQVAATLRDSTRTDDVVCRYGGEEFSVLLPATTITEAAEVAEQMRLAIEALRPEGLKLTVSSGVSATCQSPANPQDLLEQADKCLYYAKRNGRNRVVQWDQVADEIEAEKSDQPSVEDKSFESTPHIPVHAVTALISALAYRDQATANHSRRVADLCVAVAEGMLPMRSCYLLETAGLLHDVGKLGIPESILQKPSELSQDEWKVIRQHERFGRELIHTTFGNRELDNIIGDYFLPHSKRILEKREVTVEARILKIVDAFDSMTNEQPYRETLSHRDAFLELRKYAGVQFDVDLVERVINVIKLQRKSEQVEDIYLSKSVALNIGLQLEQLASAIDERDQEQIATIADRIRDSSSQNGSTPISTKAEEISDEIAEEADLYEIIRATNELMDLCRLSQRVLLEREEMDGEDPKQLHIDAI
ncbi:MAG: diguanylate cyclase [Planctomycetota bacterium]